jgi:hypothetical protein
MAVILHAPVLGMQAGQARGACNSTSGDSTQNVSPAQLQQSGQQQQQQQPPIMLGGHRPPGDGWQQGGQYAQMGQAGNAAGSAAPGQVAPDVVRSMLAQLASAPGNSNPGAALNAMAQLQAELNGLSVSAATAAMYAGPAGMRPVMMQAVDGLAVGPGFGGIEAAPMSQAMLVHASLPQLQHQHQQVLLQQQQMLYQRPIDGLQPAPAMLVAQNNTAGGGFLALQQQQLGPVVPASYHETMAAAVDLPPGIMYQQVPQVFAASSVQPRTIQQQQQQPQQVVLVPMHMGGHTWV